MFFFFFFYWYCDPRVLHLLTHLFPTPPSSDPLPRPGRHPQRGAFCSTLDATQHGPCHQSPHGAEQFHADDLAGVSQTDPAPQQYPAAVRRSEEHTSELQALMRISNAVFCLKKKKQNST